MRNTYTDRWGKTFTPTQDSIIKPRSGAFLICVHQGKIILTKQHYAMEVPEFPGGGIDPGETPEQAAKREFYEETGLTFTAPFKPVQEIAQDIHFFAEDQKEFWNYHQQYFVMREGLSPLFFEGEKDTPEQGKSFWWDIDRLDELNLHAIHKQIFEQIDL